MTFLSHIFSKIIIPVLMVASFLFGNHQISQSSATATVLGAVGTSAVTSSQVINTSQNQNQSTGTKNTTTTVDNSVALQKAQQEADNAKIAQQQAEEKAAQDVLNAAALQKAQADAQAQSAADAAAQAAQQTQANTDQSIASAVSRQIAYLPSVNSLTLADASAVSDAELAYTALTTNQQTLVINYSILTTDESQISTLQANATAEQEANQQQEAALQQQQQKTDESNALTSQYNIQINALNQQIINIKSQYYIDVANLNGSPGILSEVQGQEAVLLNKDNTQIAQIQLQEQQLYITYESQLNAL